MGITSLDALNDLTVFENGNILLGGMTEFGYETTEACWSFEHCQNPLLIMTDSNANPIWANFENSQNSNERVSDVLIAENDTNFYIKTESPGKLKMLKKSTNHYSFCNGENISVSALPYLISFDSSVISDTTITMSYEILYPDTFMRDITTSPSCFPAGTGSVQVEESDITLFPNPAHHVLNIVGSYNRTQASVFDSHGSIVKRFYIHNQEGYTLNIESFPSGLYILNLQDKEGGLKSAKFVIE